MTLSYAKWIDENPELQSRDIATQVYDSLGSAEVRYCAIEYITTMINFERRRRSLAIETKAGTRGNGGFLARQKAKRASAAEAADDRNGKLVAAITQVVAEFEQGLRLELTTEFLAASFAMGDGRFVSWGDATIAQHSVRVEMLTKAAQTGVETIACHHVAIKNLRAAKVSTLNKLRARGVTSICDDEKEAPLLSAAK